MIDAYDECSNARDAGKSPEDAALMLHARGLTIVEAIKVIMKAYDLPLGAAKSVVASAPQWRAVVEASKPLHDEAERGFAEGD
jgi:ribosomal protein L7/L12